MQRRRRGECAGRARSRRITHTPYATTNHSRQKARHHRLHEAGQALAPLVRIVALKSGGAGGAGGKEVWLCDGEMHWLRHGHGDGAGDHGGDGDGDSGDDAVCCGVATV